MALSQSISKNLRFLACEMFKLKRDMAPELIKELILPNRQSRYELRNNPDFAVPIVKSVHKDLESWKMSKNLGITASWDERNRDFFTIQRLN